MQLPKSVLWKLGVSVAAIGAGLLLLHAPQRRQDLFGQIRKRILISDRIFGGASDISLEPAVRGIRFRYGLSPVTAHPWAGLHLRFADSANVPIDLGRWERLEIRAKCTNGRPLRIQLLSDDSRPGTTSRDSTHPIYHAMEFSPDGSIVSFPWTAFTIPSWWQVQASRTDVQRLDLLDRLRAIEFHSGDSPSGHDSSTVIIEALDLVGPNRFLIGVGWVFLVLGGVGAVAALLKRPSAVMQEGSNPSSLVPEPVVLDDPRARQREQLVQALRERFADPELGLEGFASSQSLSPRLVATLIKEATGLHFKGALNELRLTEAARLLKDSRGNVSEIGYAVGFQSPSHFGRAFREKFGMPPSDYRTGAVAPDPEV